MVRETLFRVEMCARTGAGLYLRPTKVLIMKNGPVPGADFDVVSFDTGKHPDVHWPWLKLETRNFQSNMPPPTHSCNDGPLPYIPKHRVWDSGTVAAPASVSSAATNHEWIHEFAADAAVAKGGVRLNNVQALFEDDKVEHVSDCEMMYRRYKFAWAMSEIGVVCNVSRETRLTNFTVYASVNSSRIALDCSHLRFLV